MSKCSSNWRPGPKASGSRAMSSTCRLTVAQLVLAWYGVAYCMVVIYNMYRRAVPPSTPVSSFQYGGVLLSFVYHSLLWRQLCAHQVQCIQLASLCFMKSNKRLAVSNHVTSWNTAKELDGAWSLTVRIQATILSALPVWCV